MKRSAAIISILVSLHASASQGAEPPATPQAPSPVASDWTFRFVPYAWLPSMNGTQTIRGRSVSVNASFLDVVEKANTIVGLMGDFEMRRGPLTLYGDVVWNNVTFDADHTSALNPAPGVAGTVGASLGVGVNQVIIELGAGYEVFRRGAFAMDLFAGTRYWREKGSISLSLTGTVDFDGLTVTSDRAIAATGWASWVDPLVGARLRYEAAPGHNLFLRGDVGGFGAGSRNSWQAVGGYELDFATSGKTTWSGILGYRALSVDYRRGSGANLFRFDMLQHGPVLGVSARF